MIEVKVKDCVADKLKLPQVKIDVGSGDHNVKLPKVDWIHIDGCDGENVDIICDFANIPLEDKSVDVLWNSDSIEHIERFRHDEVMREWNRVLKIGGLIQGQTPNLNSIMKRYAKGEMSLEDATNGLYGWGSPYQIHFVTFTVETLTDLLTKYGFGDFDFSESPGSSVPQDSWWLCFKAHKVKDVD